MRYFQTPEARTDLFATAGCITRLQRPERQRLLPTRICNTKERTISGLRASVHPFGPPGIWAQQLPKVNVACGLFSIPSAVNRRQGVRPKAIKGVDYMSCDACGETLRRKCPAPSVSGCLGSTISTPTFCGKDIRESFVVIPYNVVCAATGFQVVSNVGQSQGPPRRPRTRTRPSWQRTSAPAKQQKLLKFVWTQTGMSGEHFFSLQQHADHTAISCEKLYLLLPGPSAGRNGKSVWMARAGALELDFEVHVVPEPRTQPQSY